MENHPEPLPGLTPEQIEIYTSATKSLRTQAAKHANLGRFSLKERLEDYYQDFHEVYYPPVQQPNLEIIANICRTIMGYDESGKLHFDRFLDAYQSEAKTVHHAKEIMSSGGRVMLVTPHRELIDVAMAMAAAQCAIGNPELVKKTRIFVGPITKELEIAGYDVVGVLQYSAGVFVSFPDTDSTQEQIASGEIEGTIKEDANTAVKSEFEHQIIGNEIGLVAVAPSGSTDIETENAIIMKRVSRGTDVLARRYFDALWPVVIVMAEDRVEFEVGDLMGFDKSCTLHDVMEDQLAPMYQRISGKKVAYQRPE